MSYKQNQKRSSIVVVSFDLIQIFDDEDQLINSFVHLVEFFESVFVIKVQLLLLGFS